MPVVELGLLAHCLATAGQGAVSCQNHRLVEAQAFAHGGTFMPSRLGISEHRQPSCRYLIWKETIGLNHLSFKTSLSGYTL